METLFKESYLVADLSLQNEGVYSLELSSIQLEDGVGVYYMIPGYNSFCRELLMHFSHDSRLRPNPKGLARFYIKQMGHKIRDGSFHIDFAGSTAKLVFEN